MATKYTRRPDSTGWLSVRLTGTGQLAALCEYTQVDVTRETGGRTYFKIVDGYVSVGEEASLTSLNAARYLSAAGPSGIAALVVTYVGTPVEEVSRFKGRLTQQWADLSFDGQTALPYLPPRAGNGGAARWFPRGAPVTSLRIISALCMVLWFAAAAPACASAAVARSQPYKATACSDFLAQMQKKPAHVRFIKCTYEPERQGKPLRAIYSVSGTYAASTEAWLIKAVGLNRLKRSCCQWDAPAAHFKSAQGRDYAIAMVSGETDIDTRTQWHKIPRFEITVETLTEDI